MTKKYLLTLSLFCAFSAWASQTIAAEYYYRWKDDKGVMHYGATPPMGVTAERIRAATGASKAQTTATKPEQALAEQQTEQQQKLQAARTEECKAEKARLKSLTQGGTKIRMKGEDGKSRYLTPAEIDKEINMSQNFINEACAP